MNPTDYDRMAPGCPRSYVRITVRCHPDIEMMPKLIAISVKLLCYALFMTHLSGCGIILLGGAAAGTAGYVSGDLKATLDGGFSEVVEAADRAIEENSIRTVSKESSNHAVVYELRTPQDDKVMLTVTQATRAVTSVTIRVGVFGDEPLSHQILNEIKIRLK